MVLNSEITSSGNTIFISRAKAGFHLGVCGKGLIISLLLAIFLVIQKRLFIPFDCTSI
jgi:hypothetical protein